MRKKAVMKMLSLFLSAAMLVSVPTVSVSAYDTASQEEIEAAAETSSVTLTSDYSKWNDTLRVDVAGLMAPYSYKWEVNGQQVGSSDTTTYTPTENDLEKFVKVTVTDQTGESLSDQVLVSKLPVVEVDTGGKADQIQKGDTYMDATLKISVPKDFNGEDFGVLYNDEPIGIKGRGNSTWGLAKKPYKLKLESKKDFFGFGKNKHWVLLANYYDMTYMRNKLAYDLSGELGAPYMQSELVDLVLDGQYAGNYQLCEHIRIDDKRVPIFDWESAGEDAADAIAAAKELSEAQKKELETQMSETSLEWVTSDQITYNGTTYKVSEFYEDYDTLREQLDGGYLLELDANYDEDSKFKTKDQQPVMFNKPEAAATNAQMTNYVQQYIQAFEDAVNADDYKVSYDNTEKHYTELFDLQSLIDNWLVQEIFYNEDFMKKSSYMYKAHGELFKMGPVWDMDWSSGAEQSAASAWDQWQTLYFSSWDPSSNVGQEKQWYKQIVQDPYFLRMAQSRYWAVRYTAIQDMIDSIDTISAKITESANASLQIRGKALWWESSYSYLRGTYETAVEKFKTWMENRIGWMDEKMSQNSTLESDFKVASSLNMSVTKADGTTLEEDSISEEAAYDRMVGTGEALKVSLSGLSGASKVEVIVNGKKAGEANVSNNSASCDIAALEKDSVIQAFAYDTAGKVRGTADLSVKLNDGTTKTLLSLELQSAPTKKTYLLGESLNLDGLRVLARYDDQSSRQIQASSFTVKGYDPQKAEVQTVTLEYGGKSVEFEVEVLNKQKVEVDQSILAANATASTWQEPVQNGTDGPPSYAFNGNTNNWWHSRFTGTPTAGELLTDGHVAEGKQVWIQTGFKENGVNQAKQVCSLTYQGRTSGKNLIGNYEIQTANLKDRPNEDPKDTDFQTVKTGTLKVTTQEQEILLDDPVEATHVRILIKSVLNIDGSSTSVAAAQIRIFELGDAPKQPSESATIEFTKDYPVVGEEFGVTVTGMNGALTYKWQVNGATKGTQSAYKPTAEDLEKFITVTATDEEGASLKKQIFFSRLPVVYIETEDRLPVTSKIEYLNATLSVQGNAKYDDAGYEGDIEIRGRGNSTWKVGEQTGKKPYKLKLKKKAGMFGYAKSKHWVLLANYYDSSYMRNKLAYDLSGQLGIPYMKSVLTDVILNGQYVGNYQFCEQVKIDENRVPIENWEDEAENAAAKIVEDAKLSAEDEDVLAEQMTQDLQWVTSGKVTYKGTEYKIADHYTELPELDGGYLLELDTAMDERATFRTNDGQPMMVKEPEYADTNKEMMNYLSEYIQAFENAVDSSEYQTTYNGKTVKYYELFDMDSLVDNWLVHEIFFNTDFMKKSTYMYKKSGELFKMGPVWDMDWTSANVLTGNWGLTNTDQWQTLFFNDTNDGAAQDRQWYKRLVKDPYFLRTAYEHYKAARGGAIQDMLDSIGTIREEIKESADASLALYGQESFDDGVGRFQDWMTRRIAWLDQKMESYETLQAEFIVTEISPQLSVTYEDGSSLEKDSAGVRDLITKAGEELVLKLNELGNGIKATIQINQQAPIEVEIKNGSIEYKLPALTEDSSILVNVYDALGRLLGTVGVSVGIEKIPVEQVTLDHTEAELSIWDEAAQTVKLQATCSPAEATVDKTVTWSASGQATGEGGTYDIVKVDEDGTVHALWPGKATVTAKVGDEEASCTVTVKGVETKYSDVPDDAAMGDPRCWYYEHINWVYINGRIMGGYGGSDAFGVAKPLKRAEFAMMVWHLAGDPETPYEQKFPDVNENNYFAEAVAWASSQGIVNGYEDGRFGPDEDLTRAQMVTMLCRYLGADPKTADEKVLDPFPDKNDVQPYAKETMPWAVSEGLIQGKNGELKPQQGTQREEAAAIIMRFKLRY